MSEIMHKLSDKLHRDKSSRDEKKIEDGHGHHYGRRMVEKVKVKVFHHGGDKKKKHFSAGGGGKDGNNEEEGGEEEEEDGSSEGSGCEDEGGDDGGGDEEGGSKTALIMGIFTLLSEAFAEE